MAVTIEITMDARNALPNPEIQNPMPKSPFASHAARYMQCRIDDQVEDAKREHGYGQRKNLQYRLDGYVDEREDQREMTMPITRNPRR